MLTAIDRAREALLETPEMKGFSKKRVYSPRKFVSSQLQSITLEYGPLTKYVELRWVDTNPSHPSGKTEYHEAEYWTNLHDKRKAYYTKDKGWTFPR